MSTESSTEPESLVAAATDAAEEFVAAGDTGSKASKPRLLVDRCNPDKTVLALRDTLATAGGLYDRGVPVRLFYDKSQRGGRRAGDDARGHNLPGAFGLPAPRAQEERDGALNEIRRGVCRARPQRCISTGAANGTFRCSTGSRRRRSERRYRIVCAEGYDSVLRDVVRERPPDLAQLVPERPTREEAGAALPVDPRDFQDLLLCRRRDRGDW